MPRAASSFIVVYYGGTGSSWLLATLSNAPGVLVPAYEPLETWHWDASDSDKLAWLDTAFSPPPAGPTDDWIREMAKCPQFHGLHKTEFHTVGFKMTSGALVDLTALLGTLIRHGTHLVFLRRRNRLKHALSLYRSHVEKKDQFAGLGEQPPTTLDLKVFESSLARAETDHEASAAFHRMAATSIGPERIIEVNYEDFVSEQGKLDNLEALGDFLGTSTEGIMQGGYRKATPDRLSDAVTNYRKLVRRYRKTRFAEDLTE